MTSAGTRESLPNSSTSPIAVYCACIEVRVHSLLNSSKVELASRKAGKYLGMVVHAFDSSAWEEAEASESL